MDNLRKRFLFFILSFLLFLSPIIPSFVNAHNAYYLQIVIDKEAKRVVGQVVYDEVGKTWGVIGKVKEAFNVGKTEASHDEYKLLKEANNSKYSSNPGDPMKMTFPTKMVENDKVINHGGAMDADRATRIANELIPAFNDYLQSLKPEGYATAEEFIQAVKDAGNIASNYKDPESGREYYKPDISTTGNNKNNETIYLFSMIKGYANETLEDGSKSPLYDQEVGEDKEFDKITWSDISAYATMNAEQGIFYTNANQNRKGNILETYLVKLLSSISLGLQSLLGLYPVGDLVFNGGARATYYHGLMSYDWASKASGFFIIFQSIALLFVNFSVIRLLHKRTLATIIPSERISLQEGIKDLFLTGAVMLMIFPFINILLKINADIVNVLRVMAPNYAFFGLSGGYGVDYNNIGGIILSFVYFFLSIYLNVVFILRAVLVAFLMATSPIFIMSIAFGKKDYFTLWLKELVANIFIQSLYAFVITFFLSIQSSSRTIEVLAISFSLIPLTKMFRSLIFGDSGGLIERAAGGAYGGMVGAGLGAGAAAAMGGVALGSNLANGGGAEIASSVGGTLSGMKSGISSTVNKTVANLKSKIGSSEGGGSSSEGGGSGGGMRTTEGKSMSNPDFASPRGEKDSGIDSRKENLQNLQNKFGAPESSGIDSEAISEQGGGQDTTVVGFSGGTGEGMGVDSTAPETPDISESGPATNTGIEENTQPVMNTGVIDTGTEEARNEEAQGVNMAGETGAPHIAGGAGGEDSEVSGNGGENTEVVGEGQGASQGATNEPVTPTPTPEQHQAAKDLNSRVGASNWSKFKNQSKKVGKTVGKGAKVVGKGAGKVAKKTIFSIPKAAMMATFAGAVVFNQGVGSSALVPTYGAYRMSKGILKPKFMRNYEERQEALKDARKKSMVPVEENGTFKKTKYNDFSKENLQSANKQGGKNQGSYQGYERPGSGGSNYDPTGGSQGQPQQNSYKPPQNAGTDMNLRNYKKPQQKEAYYEQGPTGQKNYKENPELSKMNRDFNAFDNTNNSQNNENHTNQANSQYNEQPQNSFNSKNNMRESTKEDLTNYLDSLDDDELVDFLGEEQARLYNESKNNKE